MYVHQRVEVDGNALRIIHVHNVGKPDEVYEFKSEAEACARAAIINEAMTWIGTPFGDCADIKGPKGLVDCAMFLTRVTVDTGVLPPFDPRPYNPREMLHGTRELFLEWVEDKLGGTYVSEPQVGDVLVYLWAKLFSHGAFLINKDEVIHAFGHARCVLVSRRDNALLKNVDLGVHGVWKRPVRGYDIWSK